MWAMIMYHPLCIRERVLEWLSSVLLVGWGFLLVQSGDTLATTNFSQFLVHGFTEEWLAYVMGCVGSVRLLVLWINGRWPRTPALRVVGAAMGAMIWGQIAAMFGMSYLVNGIAGTGFVVYAALSACEVLSVYWAGRDVRYHKPVK